MNFNYTQQPDLATLYGELNRLKSQQPQPIPYRTVFNDIADEWGNSSDEEKKFIDNDKDYINANLNYQQQFNSFLLELVGTQFANSKYGKSAESLLIALREAKSRYKKETTENIVQVKAENESLQKQIEELKEMIKNGRQNNII